MSDEEQPTGGPAGSIDDPDWVDQIVARALAKAEGAVRAAALEADTEADPGTTSRSVAEVAADAAAKADPQRSAPTPDATPLRGPPGQVAPPPLTDSPSPLLARPAAAVPPTETAATIAPPDAPTDAPGHAGEPVAAALTEEAGPPTDAPGHAGEPVAAALTEEAGPPTAASEATVFDDLLVAVDDSPDHAVEPADLTATDLAATDASDEEDDDGGGGAMRSIVEWGAVILGALVVAFLIKTFLLQAFFIPSGSMEPTLNIGDRVLVNKLAYDFHDVNRGDLVVFDRPENEEGGVPDLIKRVIALSGETIQFRDGIIYVDNRRLDEPYQPPGFLTSGLSLTNAGTALCGGSDVCTVPEGHVFVMGDNRSDSRDSRFFGPIPEDAIVGRAFLRVWPLDNINFL